MTTNPGYQLINPHEPAHLVRARGEPDIRAAVASAAARNLPVAVQATGHGRGHPLRGGVLIDTGDLRGVRVDPAARTAWVQAGARWADVLAAAAPHGLAPLSGSHPGVGAVSYTLGGGVGLLARRHGFAADHVRTFTVVTADGAARTVTAASEPDLFWALRGGGGTSAVVTAMEIGLMPVDRCYGGSLTFDLTRVPEVLDGWLAWTAGLPEELTSGVTVLGFPDRPPSPEPLRGRHLVQVAVCFLGSAADGARLVEPLRALGPVQRDTLADMPYARSGDIYAEPDRPHGYRGTNLLTRTLRADHLRTLADATGPTGPGMCIVGLRHLGGALTRPPAVPGAVCHRDAGYLVSVLSPVEQDAQEAAVARQRALLAPFAADAVGRSANFTFGPADPQQLRDCHTPQVLDRLAAVAARYDPHGRIHANLPVPSEVRLG